MASNIKCDWCNDTGYILEEANAYRCMEVCEMSVKSRELAKLSDEEKEELKEIPMQPIAWPCPHCNTRA